MKRQWAHDQIVKRMRSGLVAPGQQLPSERQLAEELGVSHLTVRAGLRDLVIAGLVEKRARVGNFVTQASSRLLVRTVSLVLPGELIRGERDHPIAMQLLRGAQSQLPKEFYDVTLVAYEAGELGDSLDLLISRDVSGALFWPVQENSPAEVECLLANRFPVVMLNRGHLWPELSAHSVDIDFRRLIEEPWQHLAGLGHRTVAFVAGMLDRNTEHEKHCARQFEIDTGGRAHIVRVRNESGYRYEDLDAIFDLAPRSTAVIVMDEVLAAAFIQRCHGRGLVIPDNLSLVAVNNSTPHLFHPQLSSPDTRSLHAKLGEEAARIVREQSATPTEEHASVRLQGEYCWSRSVRGASSSGPRRR